MQTVIVEAKKYTREKFQQQADVPNAKGGVETSYPFQWLLFKPQLHACAPFETNQPSRCDNTQRSSGPDGPK
jgi:hypothetical protein